MQPWGLPNHAQPAEAAFRCSGRGPCRLHSSGSLPWAQPGKLLQRPFNEFSSSKHNGMRNVASFYGLPPAPFMSPPSAPSTPHAGRQVMRLRPTPAIFLLALSSLRTLSLVEAQFRGRSPLMAAAALMPAQTQGFWCSASPPGHPYTMRNLITAAHSSSRGRSLNRHCG